MLLWALGMKLPNSKMLQVLTKQAVCQVHLAR